jgi:hypothetical protein
MANPNNPALGCFAVFCAVVLCLILPISPYLWPVVVLLCLKGAKSQD